MAREMLEKVVRAGATVAVEFADGRALPPSPIDYLVLDEEAGTVGFWWTGDETRYHEHEVQGIFEEEDGVTRIEVRGDLALVIEPIWHPKDDEMLKEWTRRVAADPSLRSYPEGGVRYGAV